MKNRPFSYVQKEGNKVMGVPDTVSKLVENSGNNFHAKVACWLSDNHWHVVVSPYYMDQTQNKAREIDLVAEKLWPIKDFFDHTVDYVAVRLFIECKFVPSYSVFWFAEKDQESAQDLVCASGSFPANNTYTKKHHYLAQSLKVVKLFATSASKAAENEPFYKALNQALNAMVSMRGQPVSVPVLKNKSKRTPRLVIEFPVVVCSSFDQIYSVNFHTESQPALIKDNFQLEVRYAYIDRNNNQRDDYFLLDFVEFSQLEKFAEAIDEDARAAAFLASQS
jgi:hypothetical protein